MTTVPTINRRGRTVATYAQSIGMAAGFVGGAAALYKAYHPSATAADIKAAILSGVPTPSLQGETNTGDRLDVSGF